ncbi:hypothetical protein [Dactylosporangium sp. NPDC006015]|uniref:hypothetical protein n=1 Tax=Dactylosporangium sp. NPDC006015 TaxID=3154576 RepID=UPI0033A82896
MGWSWPHPTGEYCGGKNTKTEEDLFLLWVYGLKQGCADPMQACSTTEYFQDGDPFTEEIKQLYTISRAREIIAAEMAAGKTSGKGTTEFHLAAKSMSPEERKWEALNTGLSIATHGREGMQYALAFIGSYDLEWEVVGKDANGGPIVEFHLTNASTVDSAKLDKGKVQDDGPDESAGDGHNAKPGEHWLQQSVRWRESFTADGRPILQTGTRIVTKPFFSAPSKEPWGNPCERDPNGSSVLYGTLNLLKELL